MAAPLQLIGTAMLQDYRSGTAKVQQFLDRPWWRRKVKASRISSRHMEMARLSALRTGRLYPSGNTPGTHFC